MINIGSSYYLPHHEKSQWAEDFARMKSCGHTVVRIGELIASWDLVEIIPGKPDFASFDAAFELANKYGLKILLGTGASSPPQWMFNKYPDICVVDRDGVSYEPGAMWSWACINHPAYLSEIDRYLNQLIERYATSSELMGWQIHNEPGFPFMPREDRASPEWFDYNPYSIAAFRAWLKNKYQDINELNNAWLWVPSNVRYQSFDQIEAPRKIPNEWGIANAWLDWRRFCCDNWDSLIARQHAMIKSNSPKAITMTNIYGAATDANGRLGLDVWSIAKQCDVIGFDLYPSPQLTRRHPKHNFVAWFLDYAMSVAKHANKPLWLPEMESGPVGGWAQGPDHPTCAADIRRWGLMALARNTKMILYQGYRQWESLGLNWGALVDWEAKTTERLEASAQLAKFMHDNDSALATAVVKPARIALLYSQENINYAVATGCTELVNRAMMEMHDTLWQLGYLVDFVDEQNLEKSNYELLILPFQVMLSEKAAKQIDKFVKNGGKLISMPRTAMVNEHCKVWTKRPGGLEKVLGVVETSIQKAKLSPFTFSTNKKINAKGSLHRQYLKLEKNVEVLAKFGDEQAAITKYKYGTGLAVHCATHLDLQNEDNSHLATWQYLLNELRLEADVKIEAKVNGTIEARLLLLEDNSSLMFCANESNEDVEALISFPELAFKKVENLWPVGKVTIQDKKIKVSIPAKDALVVLLL